MKKPFTLLLFLFLATLTSFTQNPIPAHFDECVELMANSIALYYSTSGAEFPPVKSYA